MATKTTARIHLLPARKRPIVAIIRRKPSKVFHVMRWDTRSGEIEHGSWFRGKLYPLRCDLSFQGDWLVYLASGGGNTWNGVCKLPWLRTVCEGDNDGTWYGGGFWQDRRLLRANGWEVTKKPGKLPFQVELYRADYGEDEGVLYARMERDGWSREGPLGAERELTGKKKYMVACDDDPGWVYAPPTKKHPRLRCFYRGYLEHGRTFEFALHGHEGLLDESVEWATWDARGKLVATRAGGIELYTLSDLERGTPAFARSFEDLTPPEPRDS